MTAPTSLRSCPAGRAGPSSYRERRARLANRLAEAGGGLAIVPTAALQMRNGDNEHPFRHGSHFHYLTGFDEPQCCLVLHADGVSELFCHSGSAERSVWEGPSLGPEAAPAALGVDRAHPIEQLDELLPALIGRARSVWTLFTVPGPLDARLPGWLTQARALAGPGVEGPVHRDLCSLLDEMRLLKDADEIATMRRAAAISAGAHARAMRWCAQRFRADPQAAVPEYELEAELLHEFRRHGASGPAYGSIVAAGANACVLHHAAGASLLRAGQLCLIDAGCEFDGYASDISRTFPANGRFSAAQRALYDVVVAAQEAAIDATRPGRRQRDAHEAALRVLAQGLLDHGLLARERHGDADAVMESGAYRRFYMHDTGHWLGRDVHDVGEYLAIDEPAVDQPDFRGGRVVRPPSRRLQCGMVVTLEPGLYVQPAPDVPEAFWDIGIRIEDDAVLTPSGCELISRGVPVQAQAIEDWMAGCASSHEVSGPTAQSSACPRS